MMSMSSSRRDVGLVVVGAGLVAGLVLRLRPLPFAPCRRPGRARFAVALADARRVVAVDEAVLLDAADRHLDDAVAALPDDGLLRDDVGDVVADRLAHLCAVACAVAGASGRCARRPTARRAGRSVSSDAVTTRRLEAGGQSFQRLLAAYLRTTSTQLGQ